MADPHPTPGTLHQLARVAALSALLSLSGCAGLFSDSDELFESIGFGKKSECSDVLRFYEEISNLKYKRIKAIKTRLAAYRSFSGCIQLKLAVLESVPRSPLQNTAESARLLRDYLRRKRYSSEDERRFAEMLLAHVLQTRRFLARQKALKKNVGAARDQSRQLEQLSEENENLNKKLDQLKKIDRDISRREQSVITPAERDN